MFKTIIIIGSEDDLQCFLVEGDHRHLDGVIVNSVALDDGSDVSLNLNDSKNGNNTVKNQAELVSLLWGDEGTEKWPKVTSEQIVREIRSGAELIICGGYL